MRSSLLPIIVSAMLTSISLPLIQCRSGGKLNTLAELQDRLLHTDGYSGHQEASPRMDHTQFGAHDMSDNEIEGSGLPVGGHGGATSSQLDGQSEELLLRLLGLQNGPRTVSDGLQVNDVLVSTTATPTTERSRDDGEMASDDGNDDDDDDNSGSLDAPPDNGAFAEQQAFRPPSVGNFFAQKLNRKLNQLKVKSKLLAPLFGIPASIVSPVIKFKSTLASPLAFKLNSVWPSPGGLRSVVDGASSAAAAQGEVLNRVVTEMQSGVESALQPLAVSVQPLLDALAPLQQAVNLAQQGLPAGEAVQLPRQVASDLDQLTSNVLGAVAAQVDALNGQLANVAQQVEQLMTPDLQTPPSDDDDNDGSAGGDGNAGNGNGNGGGRGSGEGGGGSGDDDGDEAEARFGGNFWHQNGHAGFGRRQNQFSRRQDTLPPPPDPPGMDAGEPDGQSILPPIPPNEQCLAINSGMVTNPCARVERYRVRICQDQKCPFERNIMKEMEAKCEQIRLGQTCQKNCYVTFRNRCTECNFTFNRILNFNQYPYCAKFKKCLYDDLICRL